MIKVENLKLSFGKNEVLKGINFKIEKGQVISIIGPSGSGKSTFLRSLNFLETASSETIIEEGMPEEIFKNSGSERLQNFLRRYYDNETDVYSI